VIGFPQSFAEFDMPSTAAPVEPLLRFDIFELDVRAGELRKRGVKVRLQGQPLQVLEALLKRPGDLVTRGELRAQIWKADTFVDFDHSLHNAIARIREALGDSADAPRYIETLPRRGYRFIGPVETAKVELPPSSARSKQAGEASAEPKPSRTHALLAFALLIVVVVIGAVLWLERTATPLTNAAPRLDSIAVLPLDNLSGDAAEDFFVDGMTDQLITDLAKVGSLRVISRTSVMRYKGTKKALPEVARELNVNAIVEGSVIRSGQRVRVTAQLVEALTDQHLWAETYDRDLGDVLKLQGEVADAIAQKIRAQLTPQQQTSLRAARPVNPAAYDAYLRGRFYFTTEFTKPVSLRKAQNYFEDAIQKDPDFALAYAGLADTYVYLAFAGAMSRDLAYRSAKEATNKAQELDDSIGELHDTLGVLSWQFEWDWDAAEREFNRAVAVAPSYSCAHEDRSIFLAFRGQRAAALAEIAKINQLDSGPSAAMAESWTYYELRDYPKLIEAGRRGLLVDPNDWSQHYHLGIGYEGVGKLQDAISEYQKSVELSGDDPGATISLAHAYLGAGKKSEAEKILRDLERKSKDTNVSQYTMATLYAGLGDKNRAFEFLDKAYSERSFEISSLQADLRLDNLRPDARFQHLLGRMHLTSLTSN
jgi:TolB-like protein/DNA-binding winged helix-turn-helix (wHTH) protein/Tfp pilus assembly protein PilF